LLDCIIATASGNRTAAERAGSYDLAIFKQGVTL